MLCIIPNITYTEDMEISPNDARDNNAPHFLLLYFPPAPFGLCKKKKNKSDIWGSQAELPMIQVVGQVVPGILKDHSAFNSRVFDYDPLNYQELHEQWEHHIMDNVYLLHQALPANRSYHQQHSYEQMGWMTGEG